MAFNQTCKRTMIFRECSRKEIAGWHDSEAGVSLVCPGQQEGEVARMLWGGREGWE